MNGFIIRDLPNEEYHDAEPHSDYLSSTTLKYYETSPKYARYMIDNPGEQTDSMRFGSVFHDLMAHLTNADGDWDKGIESWFANIARFVPPVNPKTGQPYGAATKAYTEAYSQFLAENEGKQIVDPKSLKLATDMAYSALHECGETSALIRNLMKRGEAEVSHFIEYKGVKCKFRPDLEISDNKADIIVDWKTVATSDLSERSVKNIIRSYGYDVSAAYYQMLEHEQSGKWKVFLWGFISKQPPYDCVIADASAYAYDYNSKDDIVIPNVGADKMNRLFNLHCKCLEENHWPGAESRIGHGGNELPIMIPTPDQWEVDKEFYQ